MTDVPRISELPTATPETFLIHEVSATETVTWLDIGEHGGRPVLRQWQRVGHTPAVILARYWLEKVRE